MRTDNSPEYGSLFLRYDMGDSHYCVLHMGYLTKSSMSFNKTTSVTPIVTRTSEQAFPLDGGTSKSYSFNGSRIQPSEIHDEIGTTVFDKTVVDSEGATCLMETVLPAQRQWSCEKWATLARGMVDRWQMKTDGCEVIYCPAVGSNVYVSIGERDEARGWSIAHGYISSLEYTYNSEYNELLTFYLQMTVGTAHVNPNETPSPPFVQDGSVTADASYIYLSSADGSQIFYIGGLRDGEESAVTSYTLSGGPSEPFEHIEMTLSAKSLARVAPGLVGSRKLIDVNENIVAGKNMLWVSAAGGASFILDDVSIKKTSRSSTLATTIRLRGSCLAHRLQEDSISATISGTPLEIIESILGGGGGGAVFTVNTSHPEKSSLIEIPSHATLAQSFTDTVEFLPDEDLTKWMVLQICALLLRCRIFFAQDKAYLVDYTTKVTDGSGWDSGSRPIDLYPAKRPAGTAQDWMFKRVTASEMASQGMAAVYNRVVVKGTDQTGESTDFIYTDPSVASGIAVNSVTFNLPQLVQGGGHIMAQTFAHNYLAYMREPQQPIVFTVKEESPGPQWQALFPMVCQADEIVDESQDIVLTNKSVFDGSTTYQKLYMSSYVRKYPEMTTEYTWGYVNDIDLSNKFASGLSSYQT